MGWIQSVLSVFEDKREQAVRDAELRVNPHGNARAEPWLKIDIIGTTASGASGVKDVTTGVLAVAASASCSRFSRALCRASLNTSAWTSNTSA